MPTWVIPWLSWHTVAVVLGLLLYVLATQGLQQRRPPTAAIAWVILIALLPYVGVPLFLLFGSRKRRRANPAAGAPAPAQGVDRDTDPLAALALALHLPAAATHGRVHLHGDGPAAMQALLASIDRSQHTLNICTYLIGNDAVGARLVEHIRARVAAGVAVRILVDGIGGMRSWPMVRRLRACGAQVAWFVPLLHRPLHGRTNLRNHRKLVVADARYLWSGGRNLAAEYFEGSGGQAGWVDLSFDTDGALAGVVDTVFRTDWTFATGEVAPAGTPPAAAPAGPHRAQAVPSGPDYADDTLQALLLLACFRAQTSIALATPYFVPDESLLQALCLAARRGVRVRLLLPARSNHRLADLARGRALEQMAGAGAHIEMYPGMLHAKLVAIDDAWVLLGSANIDSRSLFLNYELMFALRDAPTIAATQAWFDACAAQATPWQAPQAGLLRNFGDGLLLWLAFQM